jgi:BirA family biotin operon repressor/biotin-[acetyl-CoA-carboxylase] ligase
MDESNYISLEPTLYFDPVQSPLYEVGEVTSVLDVAWELHLQGRFPVFACVLGASQSAGRGRGARKWASPPGHVYAALRLPQTAPFEGSLASLSFALGLATALEELCGLKVKIKWPNDLIYRGGKFAGLLLENRHNALIVGIGINIGKPPTLGEDRDPLAPPVGALPQTVGPARRLWLDLAQKLMIDYNGKFCVRLQADWSDSIIDQAQRRLLGLDQIVAVHNPSTAPPVSGDVLSGKLIGLAPSGALLLEVPAGQVTVWSGTLTLNPENFEPQ